MLDLFDSYKSGMNQAATNYIEQERCRYEVITFGNLETRLNRYIRVPWLQRHRCVSSKVSSMVAVIAINLLTDLADLQTQYQNYKSTLQSLAQKVGEIEQEIEEHKSVRFQRQHN